MMLSNDKFIAIVSPRINMFQMFMQFPLALVAVFTIMLLGHAQEIPGFISIDCGLAQDWSYMDTNTSIFYTGDTDFTDTGVRKPLSGDYNEFLKPYRFIRSFPGGTRNCYRIDLKSGQKYLIRATFLYGNYDDQNKLPEFELYLGANLWDSVVIMDANSIIFRELIHIPVRDYIHICLVDINKGVPFISTIELRRLRDEIYQTEVGTSLVWKDRNNMAANIVYRYPEDVNDRIWLPVFEPYWKGLSTNSTVMDQTAYQLPPVVMSTAAAPSNNLSKYLNFTWPLSSLDDKNASYTIYMHFAEVEQFSSNWSRELTISINEELIDRPFDPQYLITTTINITIPAAAEFKFSISTPGTTYQPILNAVEIYMAKEFLVLETNQQDVEAIIDLKSTYKITRNWQGDPCNPKVYTWEGVKCSDPDNESPRIISLDLSSSGLSGKIADSIANLTMIQTLDLSDNKLSGQIPEYMSQLQNLHVLKLEKNELAGSVPPGLMAKRNFSMSLCGNPSLSGQVPCEKKNNKYTIPIVVSIIVLLLVSSIAAAILWNSKRVQAVRRYLRLGERHDVFLSFRGEDVRKDFAHYLYEALEEKGIRTFFDDEKLRAGDVIARELVRAIEESKISVIIISENYATSHWCLDELVMILDCYKSKDQRVIPIFYKVDPSDVRRQSGSFSLKRWEDKEVKILDWQKALTEVGSLVGVPFTGERYESKLIEDVVLRVLDAYEQNKKEARNSGCFWNKWLKNKTGECSGGDRNCG